MVLMSNISPTADWGSSGTDEQISNLSSPPVDDALIVYLFENFHNNRWFYSNFNAIQEGYIKLTFYRGGEGMVRRIWNGAEYSPYFLIEYNEEGPVILVEAYGGQDVDNANNFPLEFSLW